TIFINLIRMTAIPLVVSMLIVSIGSLASSSTLGRAAWKAAALMLILLVVAASISLVVAQPVLARLTADASAAKAIARPLTTKLEYRIQPADAPPARSALAQWFVDLVPQNAIKATADGSMLPIIVFTLLFAAALARVGEE